MGADDDDLGRRIADLGQLTELIEQVAATGGAFDDDQRRGWFVLVGVDGLEDAAAADQALGARHAAIQRGRIAGLKRGFAVREEVDPDARDRDDADVFVRNEGAVIDGGVRRHGGGLAGEGNVAERWRGLRRRRRQGLRLHRRRFELVLVGERIADEGGVLGIGRGKRLIQIVGVGREGRRRKRIGLRRLGGGMIVGDEFVFFVIELIERVLGLRRGRHGLSWRSYLMASETVPLALSSSSAEVILPVRYLPRTSDLRPASAGSAE